MRRKQPHSVHHDGTPRTTHSVFEDSIPASSLAEAVLPSPLNTGELRSLLPAVITDYAIILVSWIATAMIAPGLPAGWLGIHPLQSLSAEKLAYRAAGAGLFFAALVTLLGHSEGLYQTEFVRGRSQTRVLAKSASWTAVIFGAGVLLCGSGTAVLAYLATSACLSFASLTGWRTVHARWHSQVNAVKRHARNVLIVGAGPTGRQLARHLEEHPELGRVVQGFLDEDVQFRRVLGPPERLSEIARAEFVDEVIFAAPHRHELAQQVVREARRLHLDVRIAVDLYGCEPERSSLQNLGPIAVATLHREQFPTAGLQLKRVMDVVGASIALLLTAPVMLLIAGLIKLDSEGPAFYSAARAGKKGRRFRCHKFRTMATNAAGLKDQLRGQNQREGPCFKIVEDPRITRVGRWLRRYSLDELPQLWNVFRGEMSLVGPRPHPLDDYERYELSHLRRLDVTPGITGLWQVTARRSASFHTNMQLDLEYIERWNLAMDLRILWKTIGVVFRGTGT